jgi:hypothetical protein
MLEHEIICLARVGEIVSYTRSVEANITNVHIINFCMSKTIQVN